jgi:predicted NBD/HSP70 family sugar kinase
VAPVARGRRPRVLHLNVERAGILAVELRPETTVVGLARVDARFLAQTTWRTPRDPAGFVRKLADTVAGMRRTHPKIVCEGVGVSLPGRVDANGRIVFAPNLGWPDVNLREDLERAIGLPVLLENAANACALAELWFGEHPENVQHVVAVTISEGIGVGLLVNGQLVHGAGEMAGEFGHVSIDEQGPECRCGKRGCWERYASNSAAVQHYLSLAGAGRRSGEASSPHFDELLRLARAGDPHADLALEQMAKYLGIGLAGLVTGLSPELMVVVGEVTAAWDRVGPIVNEVVARRLLASANTKIVPTDASTQPRLRGAVALVVQQHFGAPSVA